MTTELPDFYQSNLKLLKKYHPQIWTLIENEKSTPVGELFLTPNGQPNIKISTPDGIKTLHDPNNPEIEIRDALSVVPEDSTGVVVLIGMGLGYMISALLEQRPKIRHLAVFDLEPGIFKQGLKVLDYSKVLNDTRLILSFDSHPNVMEILEPANKALQLEDTHKLEHLFSYQYRKMEYQTLDKKIFDYISSKSIVGATDLLFGKRFIENRLTLLHSFQHHFLLENLTGCCAGIPAILVAGGPSLDKNIHLLPRIKNKAIIIAVDSVLPALLSHGVSPDFITAIDPQKINYEKISDCAVKTNEISLIAAPYVTPEVHHFFPASKIFWTFSSKKIESWMNKMMGGKRLTSGSGTSAHLNLTAAITMGCSPIIFIGQDLAYSENKDHASGIVLNNPESSKKETYGKDPNTIWLKGIHGGEVPSHRSYLNFKIFFEEVIAKNPEHIYYNATEGGAHITGTEVITFQNVVNNICNTNHNTTTHLKEKFLKLTPCKSENIIINLDKTLTNINTLSKTVNKYDKLILNILRQARKKHRQEFLRCNADLPIDLQKKIHTAENLEKNMDNGKVSYIWELLEEATMKDVKKSQRLLHEIKSPNARQPENFYLNFLKNLERIVSLNRARTKVLLFFKQRLTSILNHQKKEKKILQNIHSEQTRQQNLFELADLYFKSNNYVMAQPVLQQLLKMDPQHKEGLFYMGAIALRQSRFDDSSIYFQKSQAIEPSMANHIEKFRRELGDCYFDMGYAPPHNEKSDSIISRKMLFKGIQYCRNHPKLQQEIHNLAIRDLFKIKSALNSDALDDVELIILLWQNSLKNNPNICQCLTDNQIADFYRHHGWLLITKNDLNSALEDIDTAFKYTPDNPELFAITAEINFIKKEFSRGFSFLNKAVSLDDSYAITWEIWGDRLHSMEQFQDAIIFYEQGVMVSLDKINLLKKIGDSYLKNGQLEAAREVYKMVKDLIKN